jgi:hypothetical protein
MLSWRHFDNEVRSDVSVEKLLAAATQATLGKRGAGSFAQSNDAGYVASQQARP